MGEHIPTVRQRRLAQALRELRHEAGLTQDAVGARMGWHTSKLFRMENARSPRVDWLDVKELMEMYGVRSPHREALIQLARDARMRGWWTPYRDVFTGSYVALEEESSAMRLYCPELVPGLLQTEDYARAVIRAVRPGYDCESVERRVTARLARQKELLDRVSPPELALVLNEAVLRRLVGGAPAMAAQLRALADAAQRPAMMLQVLPFSAGAHASMEGGFVLLKFPEETDPDVVYVEGIMGDLYLESVEEVKRYQSAFERIQAVAMVEAGTTGIWWRKSSYSGGDNNCVEVGTTGPQVAVRDSKHPGGDALSLSAGVWQSFTERLCRPPAGNSGPQ